MRVAKSGDTYKKRQALVEHPFGTIKRQWGFDHIMTKKGVQAAQADFGLILIAYNLKRILNILKKQGIRSLETLFYCFRKLLGPYKHPKGQILGFKADLTAPTAKTDFLVYRSKFWTISYF